MNRDLLLLIKAGYILAVASLLFVAFTSYSYDDPFITYRYAENLRNGLGFVYNPGERILSTTTPFFTLLLALLGKLWTDTQQLANFIGAASIAFGGLLIWELGHAWKAPLVGWSGLLLFPTFPLLLSTLGSETPLFLAFVLAAIVLYARSSYGWAVVLISLAILTRSDGVLIAAVLAVHYFWENRRELFQIGFWRNQPWFWLGVALGLQLVWHGFAWQYFGSPLPVTLAAKQAQGKMAISQHFAPGVLRIWGWYFGRWHYWLEFGLFIIGFIYSILERQRWVLIFAWTGLYFLAYILLGVTSYFWYYAPLIPGWVVAVGLGLTYLVLLPLPAPLNSATSWNRARLGLIGLLLISIFVSQVVNVYRLSHKTDSRYMIYRAVGEWLAHNTPLDADVGSLEVGIIGYFAQRTMVDYAGLIQPEVADVMDEDTTYSDTAIWAVAKYQPDYLVQIKGSLSFLKTELIDNNCEPVKRFDGLEYNFNSDIHLYKCKYD
jgi:hypothetical protein